MRVYKRTNDKSARDAVYAAIYEWYRAPQLLRTRAHPFALSSFDAGTTAENNDIKLPEIDRDKAEVPPLFRPLFNEDTFIILRQDTIAARELQSPSDTNCNVLYMYQVASLNV